MADQATGLLSNFLRRRRIRAVLPYLGEGNILDYGCGTGALANYIGHQRYLGVDLDQESIAVASKAHPAHVFRTISEGRNLLKGFKPAQIVALALIEHLPNPAKWLKDMRQMLPPQGRVMLTTPHPNFRKLYELGSCLGLFSRQAAHEHEGMYDLNKLQALAEKTGFRILTYRRFLFLTNQLVFLEKTASGLTALPAKGGVSGEYRHCTAERIPCRGSFRGERFGDHDQSSP